MTRRRVIFPDPTIWTHNKPKDNHHMNDIKCGVFGDYRRAAAIITHHAQGDNMGVVAILNDAAKHQRCAELVAAILGLYELLVPNITDDSVLQRLTQLAATWAGQEQEGN